MRAAEVTAALLGQGAPDALLDAWWQVECPLRSATCDLPSAVVRHPAAGLAARGLCPWSEVTGSADPVPVVAGIELNATSAALVACASAPVATVTPAWVDLLTAALAVLADAGVVDRRLLGTVTTVVVPQTQRDGRLVDRPRFEIESGSVTGAVGAVYLSPGRWDPLLFAEALIHESFHQLLNAAAQAVTFTRDDQVTLASPWKPQPRPPMAVLHGIVAFSSVARFWMTMAPHLVGDGAAAARAQATRRTSQVATAGATLLDAGVLSPLGADLTRTALHAAPSPAGQPS